jgi:hypothetical protein
MTFIEWRTQYSAMKQRADRVSSMINDRARKACADAGLDPELLGIHPHNAMVSYEYGNPWLGVDYHFVRLSLHLQKKQFEPYRLVEQWNNRVWPTVKRWRYVQRMDVG